MKCMPPTDCRLFFYRIKFAPTIWWFILKKIFTHLNRRIWFDNHEKIFICKSKRAIFMYYAIFLYYARQINRNSIFSYVQSFFFQQLFIINCTGIVCIWKLTSKYYAIYKTATSQIQRCLIILKSTHKEN